MSERPFKAAYEALNEMQKKAVDTIEGPVMVIAGPGTGKTTILTLRIARILMNTDTAPGSILALTFTESGALAMRERLASFIGSPAYRVNISTFHEFAGTLIRTYPEAYGRRVTGKPMSDLEKIELIESILETPSIKILRPYADPSANVKAIIAAISELKREYITPATFTEIVARQEAVLRATPRLHEKGAHKGKVRGEYIDREKKLNKNRELHFIYEAYEAALKQDGRFDFDDMIFETVSALEQNEDVLRTLQETYQYLLADEHQDVNGSQNRILELLASYHERPNIFVVGDEKQSIYRFQGASLENFLYFEEKFPHATTIALTENYRSRQDILDLAHTLIYDPGHPAAELRVPLHAVTLGKAVIEQRTFSHESIEHDWCATAIQKLIANGTQPSEIAIVVRTNREVESCAAHLRTFGIPADASADSDVLDHPLTRAIRTLMRAVAVPEDEQPLAEILMSGYVGIKVADIVRIMNARSYERPLAAIVSDRALLASRGIEDVDRVLRVPAFLGAARERMALEAPHRTLEFLLEESGFLRSALASHPSDASKVVRRLYDEVEEMVRERSTATLSDIEAMFVRLAKHGLSLSAPAISAGARGVKVMTAHKAKGLEFEQVFILHLVDSNWGGKKRKATFDIPATRRLDGAAFSDEDDERKLLYVAMTRAKYGLYLSSSATNSEGRTFIPTRLLDVFSETELPREGTREDEERFDPLAALKVTPEPVLLDPAFLENALRTRGLSVTALNNYLADPWQYFFRNVLRVPETRPESAEFGTALHAALRIITAHHTSNGSFPSVTMLKNILEHELKTLPLSKEEYARLHERGFEALNVYLEHLRTTLPAHTKEEFKVDALLATGDTAFPEVRLTGLIDRLDLNAEGNVVRVVDYKSGKPKTRGVIEGKTKDSAGDYKRQLVFYALLLELSGVERYRCREGVISFIEADVKGRIHEEPFTVTDEEIEELKKIIEGAVHDIATGAFLRSLPQEDSAYRMLAESLVRRLERD